MNAFNTFFKTWQQRLFGQTRGVTPFALVSNATMGQPQFTQFTVDHAVKHGYTMSIWVYRCVNLIAQSAASVKLMVVDANGQPVSDGHIARLLRQPSRELSPRDFYELTWRHMQLAGNAFYLKLGADNHTSELFPILPDKLAPVPSQRNGQLLSHYELRHHGQTQKEYAPQDIIHHKMEDPANPLKGISPLMAAAKAVDIDVEQTKFNKMGMEHRAVPSGIITLDTEGTIEQYTEWERKLKEQYSGSQNARRILFMGPKAKWQSTAQTPAELDFVNSKKLTRQEIVAAFGVPPILVGIEDNSSFNNMQTAERLFWQHTMMPQLIGYCETMTWALQDELGPGQRIVPDVKHIKPLQDSLSARIQDAKALHDMGVPLAELNRRFELNLNLTD